MSVAPQTSYLLGLVGRGIGSSLTPAMQEHEGREAGLLLSYRLIDIDDGAFAGLAPDRLLPEVLDWARRLGFDGLNVTHPYKQEVLSLLDDLSDDAADLGAVNTVVFRDGAALGRNTDWSGYARALRQELPDVTRDRVVVVGAGGAGAAVGYGLLSEGARHVAIFDTDGERAQECALRLAKRYDGERVSAVSDVERALIGAQGLVNATPVGMNGHPGTAVPEHLVSGRLWVSDVVYFPLETELVRMARSRGCRVLTGGGMAVQQAVGAFEHFTGRVPDAERMTRQFLELTGGPGR